MHNKASNHFLTSCVTSYATDCRIMLIEYINKVIYLPDWGTKYLFLFLFLLCFFFILLGHWNCLLVMFRISIINIINKYLSGLVLWWLTPIYLSYIAVIKYHSYAKLYIHAYLLIYSGDFLPVIECIVVAAIARYLAYDLAVTVCN